MKNEKNTSTAIATASDTKNAPDAKETTGNDTPKTPKTVKINKDVFKKWKLGTPTERSNDEETETKPRMIHLERGKRESDGYYNIRRLAFDLTKKEFRTPQHNYSLIQEFVNAKLPKGITVSLRYYAKGYQLKFFRSDKPQGEFIALDVSKPINVNAINAIMK